MIHKTIPAFLIALLFSAPLLAADPVGVKIEQVWSQFQIQRPIALTHPGDGSDRIFVVEQNGRVLWWENKPDADKLNVALDMRSVTGRKSNEEGLIGFAFHPKFKENRQVFVHYTVAPQLKNRLSRFTMNEAREVIDPKSEQVILEMDQPFNNHNGGCIAFGPDGYLYIAFGDGGQRDDPLNAAQNKNSWLGKILRIDVDVPWSKDKAYAVPKDNPLVGKSDVKPEIYAYGLRNPWRFSFDRKTGDLYAGDVGQDKWEMIYIVKNGGNYGWPVMEGTSKFTKQNGTKPELAEGEKVTPPIAEHDHGQAKSITGGHVYRGKAIPDLVGAYVYGDYQTGLMWYLRWDGTKATKPQYMGSVQEISSFGEDKDGEVYVCNLNLKGYGKLYKLKPAE
ncbi:MAG: PQQ-dependent sugar dehydrogenase [Phycisphaeraceae bacterium]